MPGARYAGCQLLAKQDTQACSRVLYVQGLRAYILLEKPLDARLVSQSFLDGREEYGETFGHYAGELQWPGLQALSVRLA